MEYILLSIFMLILGAVLTLFFNDSTKAKVATFFTLISALFACYPSITSIISGNSYILKMPLSQIFGVINLEIDPLSSIFITIISIMSLIGVVYSNGYLKSYFYKNRNLTTHYFFLLILIASMLGVTIVRNGLFFLIVWELMSLSSFFLVIFEGEKKEVLKAGIKYLIYMHLSVMQLIVLILVLMLNI